MPDCCCLTPFLTHLCSLESTWIQDLLFGTCLNGALLAALKKNPGRPNPLELSDMETFAQRMAECQKAKDQEIASEKALAAGGAANDEAEESEVTKLAKGQVAPVPSSYKKGSDEYFTATAAEMANIYVSVIAQPSTDAAFQKAISESSLSPANVKGTAGKNCVLIHLDTQLVGESQKRPNIRLPPLDSGVCQCLVSNALKAPWKRPRLAKTTCRWTSRSKEISWSWTTEAAETTAPLLRSSPARLEEWWTPTLKIGRWLAFCLWRLYPAEEEEEPWQFAAGDEAPLHIQGASRAHGPWKKTWEIPRNKSWQRAWIHQFGDRFGDMALHGRAQEGESY